MRVAREQPRRLRLRNHGARTSTSSRGIAKNGNTLMLTFAHNLDFEGNATDGMLAPGDDHPEFSFPAGSIYDGTAHANNIAACGTSRLRARMSRHFVTLGMPVMADVALAASMTSKAQSLSVGTRSSACEACAFLNVDEEGGTSPLITATVTAVQ